jgi:3-hydroxyacyl-CoA dehydrogenase / enoyl-CoA hydratase / 3-hydroxybutyryl-CoA epimerase
MPDPGVSPYALKTEIQDGVAVVTLDVPGQPVNTLNVGVRREFEELIDRLERDLSIEGAVLLSGKPDVFIAGADIEEFTRLETAADGERLSRTGQALLDSLERVRVPVVAAIHGACLGGGLETALACTYRIATDHPKTALGLPEVQLGIFPGAGGTQRLPRLIGLPAALEMILGGRNVRPRKAVKTGLVDEVVHPAILRQVAVQRAKELARGTRRPERGQSGARALLMEKNPLGRGFVLRKAREQVEKRTKGHYPAPLAAIRAVEVGLSRGAAAGYREEARLFGEMAVTNVSRELVFLFFATTALKKDTGTDDPSVQPRPVKKLGILGAGFMGAGIASVAVQQGTLVRMKDADEARVGKGYAAVRKVVEERLKKRQITRTEFEDTLSLLGGTVDYSGFGNVDLVIEAVFENLEVKHQVLRELEPVIPERAVFATNTSTIPIARIAEASRRPEQVIGMHFFSPVHKMPLLEVIRGAQTAPDVIATAVTYGKKLGKTVIVVNDGPGFYVNRILFPYVNEAGRLIDQGGAIDAVDEAMTAFGFPVGPVTLVDEVGGDVAGHAARIMYEAFSDRFEPARTFEAAVAAGRYGRKAKKGFYQYDEKGEKGEVDASVYELTPAGATRSEFTADEIQQRCVFAMLNEAVRCLEDGIIRSPRDGDVGAVFGIGFPPFRGGPFRYIDTIGVEILVQQLEELNERFPGRFQPAELLVSMARRSERFYPPAARA